MGVDCRIMLPGNVRIRDVMTVIGVAVGFQPIKIELQGGSYSIDVPKGSVVAESTFTPDMVMIKFDGRHVNWFFEVDSFNGRLLYPKSTPFWCLVGHRLVDFFGGSVDYNDCDLSEKDYKRRNKSDKLNRPTDGDEWHSLQDRMAAVRPITLAELENFQGNTGYNEDYRDGNSAYNTYAFDDEGRMIRGERLAEAA